MKSSILSKLSAVLAFAAISFLSVPSVSFAAESAAKDGKTAEVANKSDSSDAFMKFLLSKAEKYTDKAETAVSKAVDIAMEEAPALAKEFLTWRAWKHGINALIPIPIFLLGLLLIWLGWKKINDEFGAPLSVALGSLVAIISFGLFLGEAIPNILSLIQIHVAPRIYLIEQAVNLVK